MNNDSEDDGDADNGVVDDELNIVSGFPLCVLEMGRFAFERGVIGTLAKAGAEGEAVTNGGIFFIVSVSRMGLEEGRSTSIVPGRYRADSSLLRRTGFLRRDCRATNASKSFLSNASCVLRDSA